MTKLVAAEWRKIGDKSKWQKLAEEDKLRFMREKEEILGVNKFIKMNLNLN